MEKIKLSLPFVHACKLREDQKLKLMILQSKRIGLTPDETDSLIEFCKKKNHFDKGLAVIYEFAGHLDQIFEFLKEWYVCMTQFKFFCKNMPSDTSYIKKMALSIKNFFSIYCKIFLTVCSWRRLQWFPRPIKLKYMENNETHFTSLFNKIIQDIRVVHNILIKSRMNYILGYLPKEISMILFSMVFSDEEVLELSKLKPINEDQFRNTTKILESIKSIYASENEISIKWDSIFEADQNILLPVLKIPYKFQKRNYENYGWFSEKLRHYKLLSDYLSQENFSKISFETPDIPINENIDFIILSEFSRQNLIMNQNLAIRSPSPLVIEALNDSPEINNFLSPNSETLASTSFTKKSNKERTTVDFSNDKEYKSDFKEQILTNSEFPGNSFTENYPTFTNDDDQIRKRSVTIAVVGRTEDSQFYSPIKEETKRRVTVDGNPAPSKVYRTFSSPSRKSNPRNITKSRYYYINAENIPVLAPNAHSQYSPSPSMMRKKVFNETQSLKSIDTNDTFNSTGPSRSSSNEFYLYPEDLNFSSSNNNLQYIIDDLSDNPNNRNFHDLRSLTTAQTDKRFYRNVNGKDRPNSPYYSEEEQVESIVSKISRPYSAIERNDFYKNLNFALRNIEVSGQTLSFIAAKKISIWWKITAPRKKLLQRLKLKKFLKSMLFELSDQSITLAFRNKKRKTDLMKNGAAVKIQSLFKYNLRYVSESKRKREKVAASKHAWELLTIWYRCTQNAIRIFRFLRYFRRKRPKYLPRVTLLKSSLYDILSNYFHEYSKYLSLQNKSNFSKNSTVVSDINQQFMRKVDIAAIIIQKNVRRFLVYRLTTARQYFNVMSSKITFFFIKYIARRRVKKKRFLDKQATKIQKIVRGYLIRMYVFKIVSAGLKLNSIWRKYKAHKNLKSQLRRVDRPYTVVIHGVRNIPKRMLNGSSLRFKLSVWWNPLLHIVSQNDFSVIIQSKRPQYIYYGSPHNIQEEEEFEANFDNNSLGNEESNFPKPKSPSKMNKISSVANHENPGQKSIIDNEEIQTIKPSLFLNQNYKIDENQNESSGDSAESGDSEPESLSEDRKKAIQQRQSIRHRGATIKIDTAHKQDDEFSNSSSNSNHDIINIRSQSAKVGKTRPSKIFLPPSSPSGEPNRTTLFYNNLRRKTGSMSVVRQTLNLALKLASLKKQAPSIKNPSMVCNFEEETVKIPGCHGNSVFKFEILQGERKIGNTLFYLSKEGDLMYWGGEYQKEVTIIRQRRAVQFNSHIISSPQDRNTRISESEKTYLDFRVIAGSPLKSKCQWGRIFVRGTGPLKRSLQSKNIMNSFIFNKWHRFYFSLDEFGLHFFENKFDNLPFYTIFVRDFKSVHVETGAPIRNSISSKNIIEDIHNVVLSTNSGDDIFMRFQDSSSRVAWIEVFTNTIEFYKTSETTKNKGWAPIKIIANKLTRQISSISTYDGLDGPDNSKRSPKSSKNMILQSASGTAQNRNFNNSLNVNPRMPPIFKVQYNPNLKN